ncbi:MAG: cold shock domain-containing protein [Rhodoferax sp.]|uniref:cold shock domain-containing protein n=1 Tax=Rhodoferax sp. TaxID=50421 RepID=UPI00262C531E|nr:cold shock domain-containing protein [Rhodoferax sp.]MDD2878845.1 cold shock domain-containing protein [Rhodoferax sp.]
MGGMRYEGKVKKWNAERGFGFILADDSGQDIFVHITAFPRNGGLPAEGEALSFEVEPDGKGNKHAVRVLRGDAAPPAHAIPSKPRPRQLSHAPKESSFFGKVVALILVAAVGWYGYSRYAQRVVQTKAVAQSVDRSPAPVSLFEPAQQAQPAEHAQPAQPAPSHFSCDGRKYCSQMTSCKEAKLFLQNCPGMEMDGNHDGVPCEQQWCTSPFSD